MSDVLCTFPGKFGDILWALPTVRRIMDMVGHAVDFACMPQFRSLLSLIEKQSYIDRAMVVEDWDCTGYAYGAQPWQSPQRLRDGYRKVIDLGYRHHPALVIRGEEVRIISGNVVPALIDFVAGQQRIKLRDPLPFITTPEIPDHGGDYIAYAFSDEDKEKKREFLDAVMRRCPGLYMNVKVMAWPMAAMYIKSSLCFIGCRSANNVLAHGVGQKNIFIFEPNSSRNAYGRFGKVFGCPYHEEAGLSWDASPETAAFLAEKLIVKWDEQRKQEKNNAIT